jgi:hypothetical protein
MTGFGNLGAAAGAAELTRFMTAQTAQWSNARPIGFDGAKEASDPAADAASPPAADSGAERKDHANSARWTCANDNTNWIASANSAHHDPALMFDRTRCIRAATLTTFWQGRRHLTV